MQTAMTLARIEAARMERFPGETPAVRTAMRAALRAALRVSN